MSDSTYFIRRGEFTIGLLLVFIGAVGIVFGLISGDALIGALCAVVVGICLTFLGIRILRRGNHRP